MRRHSLELMDLESVVAVSPAVSLLPLGDELTLFDRERGHTLALNRTAADVLALADGTSTVAEIGASMAAAYDIDREVAMAAVLAVTGDLVALGALSVLLPASS
jgi:hypothetical protein